MDSSSILAAMAGYFVFILAFLVFFIIVMWKIYAKAGQPGWAVLVPIYNIYVYTQVIRRPGWWILVYLVPYILMFLIPGSMMWVSMVLFLGLLVISIMDTHRLSTSFGHGVGFTIGLILLGIVFYPILAFGSSTYMGAPSSGGTALDQNL